MGRQMITAIMGILAGFASVFGGAFVLTAVADWLEPYICIVLHAVGAGLVRGYQRVRRGYYWVRRWWYRHRPMRKWRG
jgi:hypothetical protein